MVNEGGGGGRREVRMEGGYKRAMGRLKMAEWFKRRQGYIQVKAGGGRDSGGKGGYGAQLVEERQVLASWGARSLGESG